MIDRDLKPVLLKAASTYPVVTLTGPRQSGKTTLCRSVFPDHHYVSLEAPDHREFAIDDPRGFLAHYDGGAIFDEVQNAPELASYIQGLVDEDPQPGRFILTGSQNFAITETVSQSLAGRAAVLHLLPPSRAELLRFENHPTTLWETLYAGSYPRIFDRGIEPQDWLRNYVATYLERDVRQILNVGEITTFNTFLRLVAGRTSAELNLSKLGADAGITHNTAKSWLSVLEASFVTFRLPAFHANLRKRLIKASKIHVMDSGLACFLIGIRDPDQLVSHPLRGAIFESWVVSEVRKIRTHQQQVPASSHLRIPRGPEIDLLTEASDRLIATEMKSGATPKGEYFKQLNALVDEMVEIPDAPLIERRVVYGGQQRQERTSGLLLPWSEVHEVAWV